MSNLGMRGYYIYETEYADEGYVVYVLARSRRDAAKRARVRRPELIDIDLTALRSLRKAKRSKTK